MEGKVALVAGATRAAGRGIAVELGARGATVYCTGRTSGAERSEMNRPETIEETAALVDAAGGRGSRSRSTTSCPTRCGPWWSASTTSRERSTSW